MDLNIKNIWVLNIGGQEVWITETIVNTWIIMLILIALAIFVRIKLRSFKTVPEGTSESLEPVCITIMDGSYVTMKNLKVKCFGRANLIEVHMSDGKLDCKIDSPDGNTEMPVEITY